MRVIRRILKLAVVAAVIGALVSWLRSRSSEETESSDEEDLPWPPIVTDEPDKSSQVIEPNDGSPVEPRSWLTCDESGNCPDSHLIKAKDSSGLYHIPGGNTYDRTIPDRCYATAEAAEADGYRASQR
ncbi:MAG: hypothetical protein QF596_02465 [Acidimicrobiales bacterium]|jgi:micrococcal nuclease|nr:hypothetical protein [Acidimicrobiales bacterium]MDP6297892.1 hypothetical protein [Acidimicrobiales bacterium]HJM28518.1 hypothetical protein [Acidimicrobiales bacterium]HJM98311.1 hypothetical protein [Acidimicrobiales bacterium]